MRKQAILDTLPNEDQQLVLQLCVNNSYTAVVSILAKPRDQGGLGLVTNRASLCRFTQKHDTDSLDDRIEPILQRLKEIDPEESLDYSTALTRLLQERIFAALVAESDPRLICRELTLLVGLRRLNLLERKSIPKKRNPNWLAEHNARWNAAVTPTAQTPQPDGPNPSLSEPQEQEQEQEQQEQQERSSSECPVITEIPHIPQKNLKEHPKLFRPLESRSTRNHVAPISVAVSLQKDAT